MKTAKLKRFAAFLSAAAMGAGVLTAMPALGSAAAENLIENGEFESGVNLWSVYHESGGAGTIAAQDGKLAFTITALGEVNYAVQLSYSDPVALYQNGVYRFHCDISASEPRYIEAMIQESGGDYTAYMWQGADIGPEVTQIDYEFTMENETDIMTKLCFNCGVQETSNPSVPHTIYLDNVSLELIDDSGVDYDWATPYQPDIVANQVGYRTGDTKTAVIRNEQAEGNFSLIDEATGQSVYEGTLSEVIANASADEQDRVADFSDFTTPGTYHIACRIAGQTAESYSFTIAENPYGALTDSLVRMFYLQRCGTEVVDADFGHPACHDSIARRYDGLGTMDVSGGWHDAGDYGRYVVAGAVACADLLWAYERNPEIFTDSVGIPESGNGVPDILDETRYELEWMLKMQDESGGVHHKVSCATFPGYVMPQMETDELIVTNISSTATGDFCAVMALASQRYAEFDAAFAAKCLEASKKAWEYLAQHPEFDFVNPPDIVTGDYGDTSDKDERYWAAAALYMADSTYADACLEQMNAYAKKEGLGWADVGDYGNLALLALGETDPQNALYLAAKDAIVSQADDFAAISGKNPYASPLVEYYWGSNMGISNAGNILAIAYQLTGEQSYLSAAQRILSHLLGENPLAVCFVTGNGTVSPQTPHHRPSMAVGKAAPGMLVGGVNENLEDYAAKAYCKGKPPAKCYVDNAESYSTNEITIYWNSPLLHLLALTDAQPVSAAVKGDVNADGAVTVADAVELQKYLLVKTDTLASWENGDMNADGKLTAADLSLLKSVLLNG